MSQPAPHTWNNEQWVIDRLAEAVEQDDADSKAKFGQRLLDGINDDGWSSVQFEGEGFYVPFEALDPSNALGEDIDTLCEEGVISPARVPLIDEGAPLEGRELERWREIVVERAFAPECATFWALFRVKRPPNHALYIAATLREEFYPNHRRVMSFVAAESTECQTMNTLKAQGFTGWKDYQGRAAEVFTSIRTRRSQDT